MAIIAPDIGIDLGTSNTLVHVRRKGIVINEPTILVVDSTGKHAVKAIGEDARALLGRTQNRLVARIDIMRDVSHANTRCRCRHLYKAVLHLGPPSKQAKGRSSLCGSAP